MHICSTVNPFQHWNHMPQGTGIWLHMYPPTLHHHQFWLIFKQFLQGQRHEINWQVPGNFLGRHTQVSQNFHYHSISLLLLFHQQVPCVELTCDILVMGLDRETQLQEQKDGWTWTHTTSTPPVPWLVLTCKHFWNFPVCWAITGPVSEELCQDLCLLGDSETLRIGDHPVKGEKLSNSYVRCWKNCILLRYQQQEEQQISFHSLISHSCFFTIVLSQEGRVRELLCSS